MEISIYLMLAPSTHVVPRLLEKIYEAGEHCVVRVAGAEEVEAWDKTLWTYGQKAFLPHGSGKDAHADQQPLWITAVDENPNKSTVYVTLNGAPPVPEVGFSKGIEMLCVQEENAIALARQRIKEYTGRGQTIKIWKQTPEGKWERHDPAAGLPV